MCSATSLRSDTATSSSLRTSNALQFSGTRTESAATAGSGAPTSKEISVPARRACHHRMGCVGARLCWRRHRNEARRSSWRAMRHYFLGSSPPANARKSQRQDLCHFCATFEPCVAAHCQRPPCLTQVSVHRIWPLISMPWYFPLSVLRPVTTAASPYTRTFISSATSDVRVNAPDFRSAAPTGGVLWPLRDEDQRQFLLLFR